MAESPLTLPWIQTRTGRMFVFDAPDVNAFSIIDIAHSLSMLCRFTGQCNRFYSVAAHSMMVADHVDAPFKKFALLHDASEAYLGDVSAPLKEHLRSPRYCASVYDCVERRLQDNIYDVIIGERPSAECASAIKEADLRALATEKRDLMTRTHLRWRHADTEPFDETCPEDAPLMRAHEFREALFEYMR